jgi:hypothetical protein
MHARALRSRARVRSAMSADWWLYNVSVHMHARVPRD